MVEIEGNLKWYLKLKYLIFPNCKKIYIIIALSYSKTSER